MGEPQFDVRYVANLARLALSEEEARQFQEQLSHVLQYIEKLATVDLSQVPPTASAEQVVNVFREDRVRKWFPAEAALANAPKARDELFIVPKVVG